MKTKKEYGISKLEFAGLIAVVLLVVWGIVFTIFKQGQPIPNVKEVLIYLGYLIIAFYGLIGYKKPHGNALKYVILCFALLLAVNITVQPSGVAASLPAPQDGIAQEAAPDGELPPPDAQPDMPAPAPDDANIPEPGSDEAPGLAPLTGDLGLKADIVISCLCMILAAYMAGRLNRIEQNRYITVIVALLLLARCFVNGYNPGKMPINSNEFNMWLAISAAYFCRFKLHKEAGLQDK